MADLHHVARVHLCPSVVCRSADAQVLVPDSVVESVPSHLVLHLAPRLVVVPPDDHVLVGTVVHVDHLPRLVREIARRVCRGFAHARTVQAKDLHVVRLQAVLPPGDLDHLVCLLRMEEARRVPHLRRALPLFRDADVFVMNGKSRSIET